MIVMSLVTLFIVIATVLPLFKINHWLVRGFDFPRFQIALCAAVVLILHVLFSDLSLLFGKVNIVVTFGCLGVQLWWIVPYTAIWPTEVKTSKSHTRNTQLSIMTANVLQTNRNTAALIQLVRTRKPDILVTLETNQWWQDQLAPIGIDMPYTIRCPQENLYGMHVFSRLPLGQEEVAFLVEDDIPSMHCTVTLRNDTKINMHFVHPAPPSPTENTESTERDAELITVARSVAKTNQPVVVTGDLNDVAWSYTTRLFRKISGLLDPRVGRGMYNTFHANLPFLRWPLDHLFHSDHFSLSHIERLPPIGSDHFALYTVLNYEPSAKVTHDGLDAKPSDEKEAKEISQQVEVGRADVPTLDES